MNGNWIMEPDPENLTLTPVYQDTTGNCWNVVNHMFAGWRGVRNNAATDDDVTPYCDTVGDVIDCIDEQVCHDG